MYDEIKKNIIERFFNKNYRYTVVVCRQRIIDDINDRMPFYAKSNQSFEYIDIILGDNVSIRFNLKWDMKNNVNGIKMYKLIEIN